MSVKLNDSQYIANTYARFPLEIVSGNGSYAYDENGKEYIDLATGIAVNTFGFSDKEWVSAVTTQLSKLQHTSNLYYTEPCVNLAKVLCKRTGMKKVFFSNSGAEANECAIKVARKYAELNNKKDSKIITLVNSFHGRTVTTLAATGQQTFHNDFLPLTEGFLYAEANNLESVHKIVEQNTVSAIMFECVQGEGGVMPLTKDFVHGVSELAKEKGILLIVDEVQTGNGRTGELYAYMNYGISPDIVTTAKGLGGGLPLGATMLSDKVENVLTPGSHGSTFGGNPVCCAGALNIINRIDDRILKEVKEKSKLIFDTLTSAEGVISISGMGLMIGIETTRDVTEIISECMQNGVLVIKAKNKIRLLPALNIPNNLLLKALDVIKTACAGKEN